MDERAAFLSQILASPDDDTVRLVYADWLEEHGEPERAQFIRVQIELHRAMDGPDPFCLKCYGGGGVPKVVYGQKPQRTPCPACFKQLHEREDRLHGTAAVSMERMLPWGTASRTDMTRGFLGRITVGPTDWLIHARVVLAQHPIQRVILREGQVPWGSRPRADGNADYYLLPKLGGRREGKIVTMPRIGLNQKMIIRAVLEAEWPSIAFHLPGDALVALWLKTAVKS